MIHHDLWSIYHKCSIMYSYRHQKYSDKVHLRCVPPRKQTQRQEFSISSFLGKGIPVNTGRGVRK